MAATQTFEEGQWIADEIEVLIAHLQPDYGTTRYLSGLRSRFSTQRIVSLNAWARSAADPIETLLTELRETRTAEEGDPIIKAIGDKLTEIPQILHSTSYFSSFLRRYENAQSASIERWVSPKFVRITELLSELQTTGVADEDKYLILEIKIELEWLSEKYGETENFSRVREMVKREIYQRHEALANFEIELIDGLIVKFGNLKSGEAARAVVDAIKQYVYTHGWNGPSRSTRTRFERKLEEVGYPKSVLNDLK